MSGGGDTTTVQQSGVPSWAVPYAQNFLNQSQQVADMPYQGYDGQTVAQLNPYQTAGIDAQAQRAYQGSPVNDAASSEVQKTLSGGYLNNNPYLSQMVNAASGDITKNYNNSVVPQLTALDARSGSFGNSGVASATGQAQGQLAEQLGNVATNIYGTDYANERNRMQTAVSQAPTIANQDYVDASALQNAGNQYQQQDQKNLSDQYSRFQAAQAYPKDQLNTLGSALGLKLGGSSTSTGPGADPYAQALGAAAAGYGAYKSGGSSSGGK